MDLTKIFSVAFGPLVGAVQGLRSMRYFNLLDRGMTPKLLRVSKRRIGLFRLAQVQTGLSPLHVASQLGYADAVQVMLNRREARKYIDST